MVKTSNHIEYIAEIGINHNGDLDLAKEHIKKAKESGATIAKFQTYFTQTRPYKRTELKNILEQCELSKGDFIALKEYCKDLDIKFCSAPFCIESAKLLDQIDCEIYKIASFHMNNFKLIEEILNCKSCKQLIISTGLSNSKSLSDLNDFLLRKNINGIEIILLHCVSQYPITDIENLNLVNITNISKLESCRKVGYSDHSLGINASTLAVALGAVYIEKHFSIDPSLPGADHAMSASPKTFVELIEACEDALKARGHIRINNIYKNETDCLEFQKITEES